MYIHTHLPFKHRFLMKRLGQFEVIDEVPRIDVILNPDVMMDTSNERALLATAVKIRAEVNSELARLKSLGEVSKHELKVLHIPNNAHRRSSYSGNGGNIFRAPTSVPHGRAVSSTSLQSPATSVIVTSSSVPPPQPPPPAAAVSPVVGAPTKIKKGKPGKVQSQIILPTSGKIKNTGRAGTKRKRGDGDPNAPKKPSNAFFWFCQEKRASLQEKFRGEGTSGQHDLTKALAKLWSETGTEDKKVCDLTSGGELCVYDENKTLNKRALPDKVGFVPNFILWNRMKDYIAIHSRVVYHSPIQGFSGMKARVIDYKFLFFSLPPSLFVQQYYHRYTTDKARYDKEMENYSLMKQAQPVAMQPKLDQGT